MAASIGVEHFAAFAIEKRLVYKFAFQTQLNFVSVMFIYALRVYTLYLAGSASDVNHAAIADDADLAAAQIRYWKSRGITKLALITSTDASGQDAVRTVATTVASAGASTVMIALPA